jgi:predicted nucleic acid-binding protein
LLDTNIVAEAARGPKAHPGIRAWMGAADESTLYLSVLTMGEIRKGIENVADATSRAALEAFFQQLAHRFADRILVCDEAVAERWGRLTGQSEARNIRLPAIDSLLAATALEHDLTLVTRNVRDFRNMPITVLDPTAHA